MHQNPEGRDNTLKELRKAINYYGFFPVFAKTLEKCYLFTVVDFFEDPVENLDKIQNSEYSLKESWNLSKEELIKRIENEKKIKGKLSNRKILFIVSSISDIDCYKTIFNKTDTKRLIYKL